MAPQTDPTTDRAHDTVALEAVADIADLLRRSRQDIALAAAMFGFVLLGLLVQAPAIRDVGGPLAPIRFTLLLALGAGLLRGGCLLALTNDRLWRPLSELRRTTAAPVRRGWRPLPLTPRPRPTRHQLLEHVRLLVSAAYDRCYLAHGALRWAVTCVGGVIVWTLLNIVSGAGS